MRQRILWLDFLAFSNLYIAFCTFLFVRFCLESLTLTVSFPVNAYCLFVSSSVFVVYTLQRLLSVLLQKQKESERDHWYFLHQRKLIVLIIVTALFSFTLLFIHLTSVLFYLIFAFFVALVYYLGPSPLKRLAGIKNFVIGFVWAFVCVFIPAQFNSTFFQSQNNFLFFFQVFCFISAICIPFDIRDFGSDMEKGIKSLPVVFGTYISKVIAVLLLALTMMISILFSHDSFHASFFVCAAAGILVVLFSTPLRHPYYFSLLTDGCLILPFLFRLLFS